MRPLSSLEQLESKDNEGTESLAINNTRTNRLLTRLALATLGRFHKSDGVCTPISKNKIIKTDTRVHLTEAATMRFVAENTTIPVPKVHCAFVHKGRAFIVMERIQGQELAVAFKKLPKTDHHKVYAQLRSMLDELRALKPSEATGVESCVGGSVFEHRLPRCPPRFGPFATIQAFHLWLRDDFQPSDEVEQHTRTDSDWRDIEKMAAMQDGLWPPPVFTHGDLNPFNILVRGDKVVAIIDWELAGWYPNYWEYTSTWLGSYLRWPDWQDALHLFLDPFPEELEMDRTRYIWWGL
ncbi:hypothetical protein B0A50_08085 [Salinomyces thailandicus]|uniref:Aminoglycoside phosphotransferase domain-containing protein n=1 Tax=Salinomyces thailandicus TaxID=706561 RepID=A0A4U0TL11_9PEZI|nr:hypothetical protein B0A50_08085 [Salinomyces thailandica]